MTLIALAGGGGNGGGGDELDGTPQHFVEFVDRSSEQVADRCRVAI